MGINKFNNEHYYDPTLYEALSNIEKAERKAAFKPLVYICSLFAGNVERNIKKACEYCRFAIESNCIPFAPHLLFPQFMDDNNPSEREAAMHFNYVMLGKCDELWVFGSTISNGMQREIGLAKKRKMPIKYWSSDCEEVTRI